MGQSVESGAALRPKVESRDEWIAAIANLIAEGTYCRDPITIAEKFLVREFVEQPLRSCVTGKRRRRPRRPRPR